MNRFLSILQTSFYWGPTVCWSLKLGVSIFHPIPPESSLRHYQRLWEARGLSNCPSSAASEKQSSGLRPVFSGCFAITQVASTDCFWAEGDSFCASLGRDLSWESQIKEPSVAPLALPLPSVSLVRSWSSLTPGLWDPVLPSPNLSTPLLLTIAFDNESIVPCAPR